jgi:hypothetical protein
MAACCSMASSAIARGKFARQRSSGDSTWASAIEPEERVEATPRLRGIIASYRFYFDEFVFSFFNEGSSGKNEVGQ